MSREHAGTIQIYDSYAAFWPFYLQQHSKRSTRLIHIIGTLLALLAFVVGILSSHWLILLAPIFGYGFAWFAHSMVEKNRPATFTYPLWSLRGDFQMFRLWVTGRLESELVAHKISD